MLRRLFGCLLALVASGTAAGAAGYDDFARGLAANNRGDRERAIADFTSALMAADLNANFVPLAYLGRARAYTAKEECALAVSDLTAALKLEPDYFDAYMARGKADECVADYSTASLDYTRAIALRPTWDGFWGRGLANWSMSNFSVAAVDFASASTIRPRETYTVLWYAMSRLRAGTFDDAETVKYMSALELTDWPGPVFDLFRGRSNPNDMVREANEGDAKLLIARICESDFYTAEWWLAHKNVDAARPLLSNAQANCPHNYSEYTGTNIELNRLK